MRCWPPLAGASNVEAQASDEATAAAFATSWNNVGAGPVYTREQFVDWFMPIEPASLEGQAILEMGFGNGSLLCHVGECRPARACGIELGDTLERARENLAHLPAGMLELHRGDLTRADLGQFDLVYCIGVLHHLEDPRAGLDAVIRHTRPGGRFHCSVYAEEGNGVVIHLVDPIRRFACRLPWWLTKYALALPLAVPYYGYAKVIRQLSAGEPDSFGALARAVSHLPLSNYSRWIAQRPFAFFHHVAFDQLVTPKTQYIPRGTVDAFLAHPDVDPQSVYVVFRNGNSWKFGGRRRAFGSGDKLPSK